ncbi:MAG TPA: malto-oligosyltrehalose synthase [Pseudonocardiaceae bacterium]|jgi:(1->4)-alpha-D-glucan 1-alpha-D-glucosylmutase|nr:malto-oligosyltrehalose synthase [Pseudonocardiaceae bacterium]
MAERGAPSSTYRLQLRPEFGFADAAAIADYLAALGVGAVYGSPMLQAAAGSTHGYDVVDPTRASADLGGEDGRLALVARLRELGLLLVVDTVPNHMDVSQPAANRWWWDVLAEGPDSRSARLFDIDWSRGPLLLPVLGDDGDGGKAALAELTIVDGELRYYERRFPIAEGTGDGTPQQVHERQHYRLISWRHAADELNYRRFFDVTNLAGVRVEDQEVFDVTHAEILRWVAEGQVDGLRIDHVDGLADPGGYLRRLASEIGSTWLVVEKILAVGEPLPADWPVAGTSGYDALADICGVFVDPAGEAPLTTLVDQYCPPQDFATLARDCRRLIVTTSLRAEVLRIARLLTAIPIEKAEPAVAELLASFDVYRSYLPDGRNRLRAAVASAIRAKPQLAEPLSNIAFLASREPRGELAIRLQQTSAMVMAKGVEDTASYRFPRLVALNEVGGDPDRFGVDVSELHASAQARQAGWPTAMTALATHDTKRGEDVRARLAVLAEIPAEFAALVEQLHALHALPEPTLELLGWQTLVGAWPIGADRLKDYLFKAAREAKLATSWTDNNAEFEGALTEWISAVLDDPAALELLEGFVARVRPAGWSNSLGQKLLQLAGPGIPDVYQGTELWDESLVDPDNRRFVDYDTRRELLARLVDGWRPPIDDTGAIKLAVVRHTLRLRREQPDRFLGYRPLTPDGMAAAHAVAFARGQDRQVVAVATRLPIRLAATGGWRDAALTLPTDATWTDAFTGESYQGHRVALGALLRDYPVALLVEVNS